MPFANTPHRYGAVAKLLHWTVFALVVYQFIGANLMTRIGKASFLGMGQNGWYEWHKSIGLVLLAVMIVRLLWRRVTALPDWSPLLTESERRLSHRLECLVYAVLIALPISGYLFVMLGGFGVKLFDRWPLPRPFEKQATAANWAWGLHVVLAYAAVVFIAWHVGHGLKKHLDSQGRFLQRMLPQRGRARPGRSAVRPEPPN